MRNKKLLVLNYEFPPLGGGASPVSFELAEELSKNGFDIDVVTMGFRGLSEYEEINKNLRVHRVKCLRSKKEVCHPWEQSTYLASGYKKCRELIKKNEYKLCHCHFIIPTGLLALRLKKEFGLDYVVTSHGSDVLGYNPRFKLLYPILKGRWMEVLRNAINVTTPSEYLKAQISGIYPEIGKKIVVVPNGIKEGKFTPLEKQKYILLVSRLTKNKGLQDFIEAIKDFDLGGWAVKIVGEGPYRTQLEKMVTAFGLEKEVTFLGWIDNKNNKLKELYGHAAIFVLPSHFENANVTLLEALQSGCKVIASDVGGNPETIPTESLFRASSPSDLKEKLASLLASPLHEKNIINKDSKHLWQNISKDYEKLF